MRDIRTDLQDRVHVVEQQIRAENARFENLMAQLRAERDGRLGHLKAQLRLAYKLLEFMAWQDKVRAVLAVQIACAEAAENSIRKTIGTDAEFTALS